MCTSADWPDYWRTCRVRKHSTTKLVKCVCVRLSFAQHQCTNRTTTPCHALSSPTEYNEQTAKHSLEEKAKGVHPLMTTLAQPGAKLYPIFSLCVRPVSTVTHSLRQTQCRAIGQNIGHPVAPRSANPVQSGVLSGTGFRPKQRTFHIPE